MIGQQKNNRTSILPKVLVTQWCLTLCDPMGYCNPPDSSVRGIHPGKDGVGCHSLLQGIFPTQESNLGFLNFR